jgi:hypothetical protein
VTVIEGTLIAESLRTGTALDGLRLVLREIRRYEVSGAAPYQSKIWTALEFEAGEAEAENLASAFAETLDEPGWYVNFSTAAETFVIYPGKVFRYQRGDAAGRAEAQAHGRAMAVPEPQLDWSE